MAKLTSNGSKPLGYKQEQCQVGQAAVLLAVTCLMHMSETLSSDDLDQYSPFMHEA